MKRLELSQYTYTFAPGPPESNRLMVLLHGTGGSDQEMIELGRTIDPLATAISVQGNVSEHGQARFFRRLSEGVYDLADLALRTDELHQFILAARARHRLEDKELYLVGYSNGANIATSLLLSGTSVAQSAVLYRPYFPDVLEEAVRLDQINILVLAGQEDPLATTVQTEDLADRLKSCGANVDIQFLPAGHGLTEQDISITQQWLARR